MSILFREPTSHGLAEIVSEESGARPLSPLVPIQPNGSKQPFQGLQVPYFDDEQQTSARLGELAAAYVESIRVLQPEGPRLLGASPSAA